MFLAWNEIIPPKELYHPSDLQDNHGRTVAMYLAYNYIIPPEEWHHDPKI